MKLLHFGRLRDDIPWNKLVTKIHSGNKVQLDIKHFLQNIGLIMIWFEIIRHNISFIIDLRCYKTADFDHKNHNASSARISSMKSKGKFILFILFLTYVCDKLKLNVRRCILWNTSKKSNTIHNFLLNYAINVMILWFYMFTMSL